MKLSTLIFTVICLLFSGVAHAQDIRKDRFGHLHTPQGVYKQDSLGNWKNASGDTYKRNNIGQWTNGEKTFRKNGLNQKTDGKTTIRKKRFDNQWEVK